MKTIYENLKRKGFFCNSSTILFGAVLSFYSLYTIVADNESVIQKIKIHKSLQRSYCYSDDVNQYNNFSSKTSYNYVFNETNFHPPPEECRPESIWMLIRHGVSYAEYDKMKQFLQLWRLKRDILFNHEVLKTGLLCEKDMKNLKNWKLPFLILSESDHLTEEGYAEILKIAKRLKKRFSEIFNKNYTSDLYKFQHTGYQKSRKTAIAFAEGIFDSFLNSTEDNDYDDNDFYEGIVPVPSPNDLLALIHPHCIDELLNKDKNSSFLNDWKIFQQGSFVKDLIFRVSRRLGFLYPLRYNTVDLMFNICQYEKAWNFNSTSVWCAVFTKLDIQVLEYMYDLSYYYNSGPGLEVNKNFGCPLLQDMILQFQSIKVNDSVINENEYIKGTFYFGHSSTLFNLFAKLGTHKDHERITADNFNRMLDRSWRTSLIDPFGSNFAALFLRCSSGNPYRVMFYLNEMNLKLNEFSENDSYVYNWDTFYNYYKYEIDQEKCNVNFCSEVLSDKEKSVVESIEDKFNDSFLIPSINSMFDPNSNVPADTVTSEGNLLREQDDGILNNFGIPCTSEIDINEDPFIMDKNMELELNNYNEFFFNLLIMTVILILIFVILTKKNIFKSV